MRRRRNGQEPDRRPIAPKDDSGHRNEDLRKVYDLLPKPEGARRPKIRRDGVRRG